MEAASKKYGIALSLAKQAESSDLSADDVIVFYRNFLVAEKVLAELDNDKRFEASVNEMVKFLREELKESLQSEFDGSGT